MSTDARSLLAALIRRLDALLEHRPGVGVKRAFTEAVHDAYPALREAAAFLAAAPAGGLREALAEARALLIVGAAINPHFHEHTTWIKGAKEFLRKTNDVAALAASPSAAPLDVERLADAIDACWAHLLAPDAGKRPGLVASATAIAAFYAQPDERQKP